MTRSLYLLAIFHLFPHLHPLPLATNLVSVSMSFCVCFQIPLISEIITVKCTIFSLLPSGDGEFTSFQNLHSTFGQSYCFLFFLSFLLIFFPTVQQGDQVILTCIYIYIYFFFFFSPPFVLLQHECLGIVLNAPLLISSCFSLYCS